MNIAEKLTTIAENEQKVYDAGKKSQHDYTIETLQGNGKRTNYDGGFACWTRDLFAPKYDIKPISACYMFTRFNKDVYMAGQEDLIDMVELLKEYNVSLDFSSCSNFTNFLLYSYISRLGTIDTRSASAISLYTAYRLKTIDLLILKDDGTQSFNFTGANQLKNITIAGVIGQNINMGDCPLLKDSIISVINALSTKESKKTVTFKKTAVDKAFETSEGLADGSSSAEWIALITPKSNQYDGKWTISLI